MCLFLCILLSGTELPELRCLNAVAKWPDAGVCNLGINEGFRADPGLFPYCIIYSRSWSFLELYNENTNFVAAKVVMTSSIMSNAAKPFVLRWDHITNPVVHYNNRGVYRCRTDTATSPQWMELQVGSKTLFYLIEFYVYALLNLLLLLTRIDVVWNLV